jgi:hypothetical protein
LNNLHTVLFGLCLDQYDDRHVRYLDMDTFKGFHAGTIRQIQGENNRIEQILP